jgi:hypothetical protein
VKNVPTKSNRKARRKDRIRAPRNGLGATRERSRQNGGIILEYAPDDQKKGQRVERHRATYECQLDRYLSSEKIDIEQFKAGMRFREAWQFKANGIKTVDSTEHMRIDNAPMLTPEQRQKKKTGAELIMHQAYKEAGLTVNQTLVIDRVCGEDEPTRGDADIKTLSSALDKLAWFWGISPRQK